MRQDGEGQDDGARVAVEGDAVEGEAEEHIKKGKSMVAARNYRAS